MDTLARLTHRLRGQLAPRADPAIGPGLTAIPAPPASGRWRSAVVGDVHAERRASRRAPVAAELVLGFLLLIAYVYFRHPPGPNELTRLFSIQAFVDYRTLNIDRFAFQTPDKAFYDGHYYSDKAPGTFLLGVPIYWSARHLATLYDVPFDRDAALGLLQLTLSAAPSAVLGVGLARLLRRLGLPTRQAIDFAALYGLGTIAFSFATLFFGHQLAAALAFAGCALLVRGSHCLRPLSIALAGTLCSLAVVTEYSVAIVWLALLIYVGRRGWWWFCLGGLPPAAALAIYNLALFDSPFRLGYAHVDNPDFAMMRTGLFGLTYPTLQRLADVLVSGRGLLIWSPFLIFAWRGYRRLSAVYGRTPEARLFAAIGLAYVAFDASYYAPFGHWSIGPRFLIPSLPYIVALAAFGIGAETGPETRGIGHRSDDPGTGANKHRSSLAASSSSTIVGRILVPEAIASSIRWRLFQVTACWSVALVFLGTAIDPKPPGQFVFPLVDYYLVRLANHAFAPNLATLVTGVSPSVGVAVLALLLAIAWRLARCLTPDLSTH